MQEFSGDLQPKKEINRKKNIIFIKEEIKEKYPKEFQLYEKKIQNDRDYTAKVKDKYPILKTLKTYATGGGFEDILINTNKGLRISVEPLVDLITVDETYLPRLEKIYDFAPDYFDKGLKQIIGNIQEEISGHEQEHTKDIAIKSYMKKLKTQLNIYSSDDEVNKIERKSEFYTESQRILKYSKNPDEAVDKITTLALFGWLLESGVEHVLEGKLNEEYLIRSESKSPDETSVKGLYPYLNEKGIKDVLSMIKKTRENLKQKYEDKYGKIGSHDSSAFKV